MSEKEKKSKKKHKIPDGEWGIHFSDKSLPEERFDPFCSYFDQDGTQVGYRTIFNPIRLQRPFEFRNIEQTTKKGKQTTISDPFCELVNGKLPSILITKDRVLVNDLFSCEPVIENLSSSTVFSAINLYPPISRIITDRKLNHKYSKTIPIGLSLIHVFSKHYELPEQIPKNEWEVFFQNYKLTLKEAIAHPVISSINNVHISTFFNIGARAGASIAHLHGQTILQLNPSGNGVKQNSYLISSKQNENNCKKCQIWEENDDSEAFRKKSFENRVLFRNFHWCAILAFAPRSDAQIRLVPYRHISNIWSLNDDEISSLASILIKSNKALTSFILKEGKPFQLSIDRNIILNQYHSARERHFHMFIDILAVQQTGGAEILDDQKFSMIYPEDIARKMISDH